MDLNAIWFVLIGILLTGYAVLDGFDLGVGIVHLFTKKDEERRIQLNAVGPVWDGNEVWLVTAGGALFAAFPYVYATVFSGFYFAFILLLFALIFRAVSIEFRSKLSAAWWRKAWDAAFSLGSILASILIGIAFGNIIWGIPLSASGEFLGDFKSLIHPYSILVGSTVLAFFAAHGACFLLLKTEGTHQESLRAPAIRMSVLSILCYVAATVMTFCQIPHVTARIEANPWLYLVLLANLIGIMTIPWEVHRRRYRLAFTLTCSTMIILWMLFGIGMFPCLVVSNPMIERSLTIYNASSTPKTLSIMLVIASIALPLILLYTFFTYRVFRGKVKLEETSY